MSSNAVFVFDGYELDTVRFELRHDGTPIPIEPQVFSLLVFLVTHRERMVTKDELHACLWGDRIVSEAALSTCIRSARRALSEVR